ncbi:FAD-dependent monooxygenase [Sphingomonas sp. QA11]|uniref:FAD-dependent monooxygenase n=1 Tax=Sphingomonas sp. QA11 TaxID=2950605 RepID=UPI00234A7BA0|nr:FAD-dependent monooxygenase [Sphingomonas sp. QA11]WCM25017.1 FAD-dependent monooxygenase [Sphingomonas sp. QA11]
MIETDVVVVGAGPVGLAASIELGMRGARVVLVERNSRVGVAPRAKTTNVRTRTHLRRWGIAEHLAHEAPFGIDYPNNMVFVTRIGPGGHELARFGNAFNASPERDPRYPEHGQWVPQYKLEKVLLEKVRELPNVEVRFDTSFVSAQEDDGGVTVTLRSDSDFQIRSAYMIGADGGRSAVRNLIGAKLEGQHGLSHHYNIIFRAPGMSTQHDFGPAAIYWQIGKDGFSAVGPMDVDDLWFFSPGGAKPGTSLSDDQARSLIRERTGVDLPFEILSADSWTASELLADKYAEGRIFLAGDACHLHPPAGGYGMNMGVGDGVDLGWKIAAVLHGWGGDALLASYEAERRPVHRAVMDEAMANYAIYVAPPPPEIEHDGPVGEAIRAKVGGGIQASKAREFRTLGTVLGLCYADSPVLVEEGTAIPERDSQNYVPTARPGCLAPHAWLADGRSLYDLFGDGFTLLADTRADPADVATAVTQASQAGVPLKVIQLDDVDVAALYGARLALVRPDQHVAWRGDRWAAVLDVVTGRKAVARGA